jgi:hypothetical protein
MMCAGWIRFRASLMTMHRTSWNDQRINDRLAMLWILPWLDIEFFWRQRIGALADHRHQSEGEHHKRNVAIPPMPGSALVVIESELVSCARPAPKSRFQLADAESDRAPASVVVRVRLALGRTLAESNYLRVFLWKNTPFTDVLPLAVGLSTKGLHGKTRGIKTGYQVSEIRKT